MTPWERDLTHVTSIGLPWYECGTRKTPLSLVAGLTVNKKGVALTNANSLALRVVPWTRHSALVLSTLALIVTVEVEMCYPTTTSRVLIHRIPDQLALWVVPLYWSGHWSCGLHTEHPLTRSDGQRHVRWRVKQASAAILKVSSVHWESEKEWQEEVQKRLIVCNVVLFSSVLLFTRHFEATRSTKNTASYL